MITFEGAAATRNGKALQNAFCVQAARSADCTPGISWRETLKQRVADDIGSLAVTCAAAPLPAIFRSVDPR